ncbi:MAG: hypothetical protein KJ649_12450 [Proteobacteria bacterium]|nr:hypothetical protein [Pseudomonadota bacterium]
MNRILLVERIHQAGEAMLVQKAELVYPQPQNLEGILAAIGDCNALIVRNTKITRQIMEAAPKLAVIGRHGVGYDTVDIYDPEPPRTGNPLFSFLRLDSMRSAVIMEDARRNRAI